MNFYNTMDHLTWHRIRLRFENAALNTILFGTFSVITSTFIYRYSLINSDIKIGKSVDINLLFYSTIVFFISSLLRYFGHFVFLHVCPDFIQSNKDIDALLKISKDTIVDTSEWASLYSEQIARWNAANVRWPVIRFVIGFNEVLVLAAYVVGVVVFYKSIANALVLITFVS